MSPTELVMTLLAGLTSLGGVLYWVKTHAHAEYVTRAELVQLEIRLDSILLELRYLRARLDKQSEGG